MAYTNWAEQLFTSHFSGSPVFFQPVRFNRDLILHGVRSTVNFYNNPTLTSLEMRVYTYKSQTPRQLIVTSSVQLKSACITEANGARDIPFFFSPRHSFIGGDWYAFVLWANGYTGDETSHIAWMKDFPDPVNPTGLTLGMEDIAGAPFRLSFIGANL